MTTPGTELAALLEKTVDAFGDAVAASMQLGAQAAEARARSLTHPNVATTVVGIAEREGFALEAEHKAARFIEVGTRAHIIEGRLAFQVAGNMVFARRVHHPGTKAHPYMHPGMEEGARVFAASMGELFGG